MFSDFCPYRRAIVFRRRLHFCFIAALLGLFLAACSSSSSRKDEEKQPREEPSPIAEEPRSEEPPPIAEEPRSEEPPPAAEEPRPAQPSSDTAKPAPTDQPQLMVTETIDELHERLNHLISQTDAMLLNAEGGLFELSEFPWPGQAGLRARLARQSSALNLVRERLAPAQPSDFP